MNKLGKKLLRATHLCAAASRRASTASRGFLRLTLLMLVLLAASNAMAQTTQFTYQGKLTDNGNAANGQYDFLFKLFDTAIVGTGAQLGSTVNPPPVTVTEGIFTVQLDFGVSVFPGAARFLEIAVKQTSGSTFTTLGPRQPVTSNPYAIRSLAATAADGLSVACLGCITSSQIQTVQGSQVTGLIPVASVPPGSDNYIQNTNTPQASVNFNIGGTGTANILNATTQFNLGGNRILSSPVTDNLFAGIGAGASNTTGAQNSFFGINAGQANTAGGGHSFFGAGAGRLNTAVCCNSFFGREAGKSNTTGTSNSFFGDSAGQNNSTGLFNSFFGHNAGRLNTTSISSSFFGDSAGENNTGGGNSFFGAAAGQVNTTGGSNSFFGERAGLGNTTGSLITIIGARANVGVNNLDHATVIGADAVVSTSNTVVLGRAADTVQIPGALNVSGAFGANILNAVAQFNLGGSRVLSQPGSANLFAGAGAGNFNTPGILNSFFGNGSGSGNTGDQNAFFGMGTGVLNTGSFNSFFGNYAGNNNTSGALNTFVGQSAGGGNMTGGGNSFFGREAGLFNNSGFGNSFFGLSSGRSNTQGGDNSFFGEFAGLNNTMGAGNTFVGYSADFNTPNPTGDNNTLLGVFARVNSGVSNSTAIGYQAQVTQSNSIVLGNVNTANVGIGTTIPAARLHIKDGGGNILFTNAGCTPGLAGIMFASAVTGACQNYALLGGDGNTYINRPSGGSISFREGNFTQMTINNLGVVAIEALGAAGLPQSTLCRNAAHEIAVCSSSLRYKTNLAPYRNGLEVINRLKPITFTWKEGGMRDIGLAAEEVEAVEPLLTFRNDKGEIEGVKYSQLSAVFVNAFKEQQSQLTNQHQQIKQQQQEIETLKKRQQDFDALKRLVCADHPAAQICKSN
jgi:hypothetical protein